MILSDTDILAALETGELVIEPLDDIDTQVQPASVDVRLGDTFLEFQRANVPYIHPDGVDDLEQYVTETVVEDGEDFILHPGDFVLGTTKERVAMPADLVGSVEGRSSLGRLAIVVHATAGWVDNGYNGEITLELANLGKIPVALTPGMRVAQLVIMETRSPAERPYGDARGSKYDGQTGPTMSRFNDDAPVRTDSR